MSLAVKSSGTQTATVTTEHSLLATTDSGIYVLCVNLVNMAAGDVVELRIKVKVLSGDTVAVAYYARFCNAAPADNVIQLSVPVPTDLGATFTLKMTAGVSRDFPWKVLSL